MHKNMQKTTPFPYTSWEDPSGRNLHMEEAGSKKGGYMHGCVQ